MYLIPLFQLYTDTSLYDTWLGMALFYSAIATPFCLFVMRGFFSTVETEIEDAAKLDGANSWTVLWRILMPLARGPIAVLDAVPVHVDLERLHVRPRALDLGRRSGP